MRLSCGTRFLGVDVLVLAFWDFSYFFLSFLQPPLNGMEPTCGFCVGDVQ